MRSSFVRVSIPGLGDFCFPSGILSKKLRKTKSNSSLLQVVYSQSYHHEPENAYVFLLTTAEREFLYGVCVIKHESVYVRGLLLSLHNARSVFLSHWLDRLTFIMAAAVTLCVATVEQAVVLPARRSADASGRWI